MYAEKVGPTPSEMIRRQFNTISDSVNKGPTINFIL